MFPPPFSYSLGIISGSARLKKSGDIISGSIWGSFQGWGSFRGWDHFGGCTVPVVEMGKEIWRLANPLFVGKCEGVGSFRYLIWEKERIYFIARGYSISNQNEDLSYWYRCFFLYHHGYPCILLILRLTSCFLFLISAGLPVPAVPAGLSSRPRKRPVKKLNEVSTSQYGESSSESGDDSDDDWVPGSEEVRRRKKMIKRFIPG